MVFKVYSCGSNGRFQLGNGTDEDSDSPGFVFQSEFEIVKIVCGGNHSLILLSNGDVLAAGDNSNGQCGVSGLQTLEKFVRIEGKWKDCSAGYEFSVLVSVNDAVYSCGLGLKGELGQGKGSTQSGLEKVDLGSNGQYLSVKSCLDHTVLLLSTGDLYVWGNGRNGKLIEVENKIWQPKLIHITDMKVEKIEVGRDFTLVSDGTRIKLYGKDRYEIESQIPDEFEDFKTMWSSLHFKKRNSIVSIGNNSHSQLLPPEKQIAVEQFDVGSEHGLILSSNKVYSWGWGEHGNCGKKLTESTAFDLCLLFESPNEENIVRVQGGCATSWIITSTD